MEQQSNPEILHWRDLEAEDVYHLAHLEDETRDLFASQVNKIEINIAFSAGAVTEAFSEAQRSEAASSARDMVKDYESYAQSWLGSQALVRGLVTEVPSTPNRSTRASGRSRSRSKGKEGVVSSEWFNEQLASLPGLTSKRLAEILEVSGATISNAKTGRKGISRRLSDRIVKVVADEKGLQGDERQAFIASAVPQAE